MPTYISLINFTQKGVEAIKDGPEGLLPHHRPIRRRSDFRGTE